MSFQEDTPRREAVGPLVSEEGRATGSEGAPESPNGRPSVFRAREESRERSILPLCLPGSWGTPLHAGTLETHFLSYPPAPVLRLPLVLVLVEMGSSLHTRPPFSGQTEPTCEVKYRAVSGKQLSVKRASPRVGTLSHLWGAFGVVHNPSLSSGSKSPFRSPPPRWSRPLTVLLLFSF